MSHFNKLTPAEAERLALLMEECAEVQQVIGKILRHGYESCSPFDPKHATNRQLLERELGDMSAAFGLLLKAGDVDSDEVDFHLNSKLVRVKPFLHHQEDKT